MAKNFNVLAFGVSLSLTLTAEALIFYAFKDQPSTPSVEPSLSALAHEVEGLNLGWHNKVPKVLGRSIGRTAYNVLPDGDQVVVEAYNPDDVQIFYPDSAKKIGVKRQLDHGARISGSTDILVSIFGPDAGPKTESDPLILYSFGPTITHNSKGNHNNSTLDATVYYGDNTTANAKLGYNGYSTIEASSEGYVVATSDSGSFVDRNRSFAKHVLNQIESQALAAMHSAGTGQDIPSQPQIQIPTPTYQLESSIQPT